MTISVTLLSFMVLAATAVTMLAPLVLLILWIRDFKKRQLW
jgi:hypothetical protein